MKLKTILLGQSVRFIVLREPTGGIFAPDFLKLTQTEFKFVTIPKSIAEMDRSKGINFEHGLFQLPKNTGRDTAGKSVVIDKLQVFTNGLLAETRSYSEDADLILDSFIEWSKRVLGIVQDQTQPVSGVLLSNIEVEMKNPFDKQAKAYSRLTRSIASSLRDYGFSVPEYEQIGFELHIDKAGLTAPIPTSFKLERRAETPFSSNTYFSSAPMKTKDHLELLAQIEAQ